jgi:twitching motility protein PilT
MTSNTNPEPRINPLFRIANKHSATSLELIVGQPPMARLRGEIRRMDMRPLTSDDMGCLLHDIMTADAAKELATNGTVDFTYVVGKNECQFRCRVSKTL